MNNPPIREMLPVQREQAQWPTAWASWFQQVFQICFAAQQSGLTASRPTVGLYPGRPYFDTSLGANGRPIWVNKNSTGWVDATGGSV